MKKSVSTLVLTFCVLLLMGQAYHPLLKSNRTWDVLYYDNNTICQYGSGSRFFIQGDTIKDGITYYKIATLPIINVNPGSFCPPYKVLDYPAVLAFLAREDSLTNKVYYRDPNAGGEDLMYDFSFNHVVGDTLTLMGLNNLYIINIQNIALLDGEARKLFTISGFNLCTEGVGSNFGLFNNYIHYVGGSQLVCVRDNGVPIIAGDCSEFVGIEKPDYNQQFLIFPNPAKKNVWITIPQKYIPAEIQIINIAGNILYDSWVQGLSSQIDVTNFTPGTYVCRICSKGEELFRKLTVYKNY